MLLALRRFYFGSVAYSSKIVHKKVLDLHAACRIIMPSKEMEGIKKLSEVCKIVGVTRRTLQEYEKVGLVAPTSKTDSGYWLYDDAAIAKLNLIKIFVEGGYERKTIKALLESPQLDIADEFNQLVKTLEAKRKRIDGMISTIKMWERVAHLPMRTLRLLANLDMTHIYQVKSFASHFEDSISRFAEHSKADNEESEVFIPFWFNLIAIGCSTGTPVDAAPVQIAVRDAYRSWEEMHIHFEKGDAPTDIELVEEFAEGILYMASDSEAKQTIESQCGNGAVEYILQAIQAFRNNMKNKYT